MSATVRVLIVDDSATISRLVKSHLSTEAGIEVVSIASDGEEGVLVSRRLNPDLVLMDMNMPGMSGLDATRRIKAEPRSPRVVILSFDDQIPQRAAASAAGADGFCSKADMMDTLIPMIRALFPE